MKVQLLVSDSDVKSYKQIKVDLDGLRLLVEKSELWVFKSKSVEEKTGKTGSGPVNSGQSGSGQAAPLVNGGGEEDEGDGALRSLEEKVNDPQVLLHIPELVYRSFEYYQNSSPLKKFPSDPDIIP